MERNLDLEEGVSWLLKSLLTRAIGRKSRLLVFEASATSCCWKRKGINPSLAIIRQNLHLTPFNFNVQRFFCTRTTHTHTVPHAGHQITTIHAWPPISPPRQERTIEMAPRTLAMSNKAGYTAQDAPSKRDFYLQK